MGIVRGGGGWNEVCLNTKHKLFELPNQQRIDSWVDMIDNKINRFLIEFSV